MGGTVAKRSAETSFRHRSRVTRASSAALPSPRVGEGGERSSPGEGVVSLVVSRPVIRHGLRPRHLLPQGEKGRMAARMRSAVVGWVELFAKPIASRAMGIAALNPSYLSRPPQKK